MASGSSIIASWYPSKDVGGISVAPPAYAARAMVPSRSSTGR
ncbi:hypothetical protein SCE1572_38795 [Sorangium cellulosum So0157-2]|uniref:Uncharacterized protein n=1 Tax=Sorangium cellulosum So0157-2 TaxID=1254432 RepID=S4Y380_SORCE|nr:hypothetical protein SCE1572_38795 [Sorangium cellulosum So0157-2]